MFISEFLISVLYCFLWLHQTKGGDDRPWELSGDMRFVLFQVITLECLLDGLLGGGRCSGTLIPPEVVTQVSFPIPISHHFSFSYQLLIGRLYNIGTYSLLQDNPLQDHLVLVDAWWRVGWHRWIDDCTNNYHNFN